MKPHSYQAGQENQLDSLGIMVNFIVLWQTACTQAGLEHLAANGCPPDPADVARLTPPGHPTINLDGQYRTTSRPPTTGLRPLRTDLLRIPYRSSSQASSAPRRPAGLPLARTRPRPAGGGRPGKRLPGFAALRPRHPGSPGRAQAGLEY
jgi:hypothetical protein